MQSIYGQSDGLANIMPLENSVPKNMSSFIHYNISMMILTILISINASETQKITPSNFPHLLAVCLLSNHGVVTVQGVEEAIGEWQDRQYRETQGSGMIFGDFRLAFFFFLDLSFSLIEVLRSAIFFFC